MLSPVFLSISFCLPIFRDSYSCIKVSCVCTVNMLMVVGCHQTSWSRVSFWCNKRKKEYIWFQNQRRKKEIKKLVEMCIVSNVKVTSFVSVTRLSLLRSIYLDKRRSTTIEAKLLPSSFSAHEPCSRSKINGKATEYR